MRSKEYQNFKKMLINFRKKGFSAIIPFVHKGKEEIHKYVQYEVSMTVCMGRIANQRKAPKWLPLTLVDPGTPLARAPQWDPILSFLHTFLPKIIHVRGRFPPTGQCPAMGNPGSTTDLKTTSKNY